MFTIRFPASSIEFRRNAINLANGDFSRPSEGSYFTTAPTDGNTGFLSWAPSNVLRLENRGEGFGQMALIEGQRINKLLNNEAIDGGSFFGPGSTNTGQPSPDSGTGADWVTSGKDQYREQDILLTAEGHVASWWVRAVPQGASSTSWVFATIFAAPPSIAEVFTPTTTYQRRSLAAVTNADIWATTVSEGRATPAIGGYGVATANEAIWTLGQVEAGYFPSSVMRTSSTAVTRSADILSFPVGRYPVSFLTKGFRISICPDFTDTENVSTGTGAYLFSFNLGLTNGAMSLGADRTLYVYIPGVGFTATSTSVTFSRGQKLTIDIQPELGRVTLSGATTGNGTTTVTPWAFGAGTFYIGTLNGTSVAPFFGRFDQTIIGL